MSGLTMYTLAVRLGFMVWASWCLPPAAKKPQPKAEE
jgi:hypothetical protein